MASRLSSKLLEVSDAIGWKARIPPPFGPYLVDRFHFRIPGDDGVFTQIFYPMNLVVRDRLKLNHDDTPISRIYRTKLGETSKFLFDLLAGTLPEQQPRVSGGSPSSSPPPSPLPPPRPLLPLVLFSHGLIGNSEVYSKTCSDIASFGFIVVALEHEDGSGAFARSVSGDAVRYRLPPMWGGLTYERESVIRFRAPFLAKREREIRRTIEFFSKDRQEKMKVFESSNRRLHDCLASVDSAEMLLAGHSFGAATVVHMVRASPDRFRGALLLDLWPYPLPDIARGIRKVPVCSILSEQFAKRKESELIRELLASSDEVRGSYYVPGTLHIAFSDMPWWASSRLWMGLLERLNVTHMENPDHVQKCLSEVYSGFLGEIIRRDDNRTTQKRWGDASMNKTLVPFR